GGPRDDDPHDASGTPRKSAAYTRSSREERGRRPLNVHLARATTQVKILVPGNQPMVALLGQRDELLKLVEAAFDSQIVVRGNEITITGPQEEADKVGRLLEDMVVLKE